MRTPYRAAIVGWFFITLLFEVGCAGGGSLPTPAMLKRTQMQMGTLVTITAVAPDRQAAQEAASAGFQEIHRLEGLLSTWIASSELSLVNAAAGREAIAISPDTMRVLESSVEMARLTEGGFNILVGPAVEAWNVLDRQQIPSDGDLQAVRPLMDLEVAPSGSITGDGLFSQTGHAGGCGRDRQGVCRRHGCGGDGEGWGNRRGCCLVRRYKDLRQLPNGATFPFAIRHPRSEDTVLAFLDLQNEAISTAGDYERYFERDGVRYHHILDPVTLQPARDCQSVTVVAKDGMTADGLDTGIFVMGRERGLALVERLPGVGAVIVDRDGKVWVSSYLKGRVRMNDGIE